MRNAIWIVLMLLAALPGCASTPVEEALSPEEAALQVVLEDQRAQEAEFDRLAGIAEASPRDGDAWYRLGNALFDNRRYDEALAAYERTLEVEPGHVGALCNSGLCHRYAGNMAAAAAAYERALAVAPDDATTLRNYAFLLEGLGDWEGLRVPLLKLSDLFPSDARIQEDAARLLLRLGRNTEAVAQYGKAVALNPSNPDLYYGLGLSRYNLEDWGGATGAWASVLTFDPGHAGVHRGMARLHLRRENYDQAWNWVGKCEQEGILLEPEFIRELQDKSGQVGPSDQSRLKE